MSVKKSSVERDMKKEGIGWVSLVGFMLLFPILFYLCVYFPMWIGFTPR